MHNALLVRWGGGWHEVTDSSSIAAHWRSEALLGIGAIGSVDEVERVATAQLDIFANPRTEIAADLAPVSYADSPYLAFAVGDTVLVPDIDGTPARERLRSLTVSEDDDGIVTFAPELADVILDHRERWEQALGKMTPGTIGGQSSVATPAAQVAPVTGLVAPSTAAPAGLPPTVKTSIGDSFADSSSWVGFTAEYSDSIFSTNASTWLNLSAVDTDKWAIEVLGDCHVIVNCWWRVSFNSQSEPGTGLVSIDFIAQTDSYFDAAMSGPWPVASIVNTRWEHSGAIAYGFDCHDGTLLYPKVRNEGATRDFDISFTLSVLEGLPYSEA